MGKWTWLAAPAALTLSGCGDVVPGPAPASFTPASPRPAGQPSSGTAQASNGVIGADARALVRLFGEPRLDIRDPAARKLQFGDGRCVLDAYLYPAPGGREPLAAYAEARRNDGTPMDVAACAAQLRAR